VTGQIALLTWPLVAFVLFQKLSVQAAFIVTIIGGFLLLPTQVGWDFPLLPALGKNSIPALVAMLLVLMFAGNQMQSAKIQKGILPRSPIMLACIALLVLGAFGTVLTNRNPLFFGPRVLSGMSIYDGFSIALSSAIQLIPFLLARKLLHTSEQHALLLKAIVIAAFCYSFLALIEIRISPQLNNIVYGFFPHSFIQHIRGGGFRPLVFLSHGLVLGIFFSTAVIAAWGLYRHTKDNKWLYLGIWILGTLAISKTLGAFAITLLILALMICVPKRLHMTVIACISASILLYPMLKGAGLVPTERVVALASAIDPERAGSLNVRLRNEDMLLDRANQKPIFGWGSYGRNRIYNEWGRDVSITDGGWVITIGGGGWVRYIGRFGLLTWAMIALYARRKEDIDPITITLGFALCANMIDAIPNSGITPITMVMAGALAGRLENRSAETDAYKAIDGSAEDEDRELLDPREKTGMRHSRFGIRKVR